ncbi:MAG: RNA-directed DNA polymerase [Clostridia bacterium]|nr:RNA-directed DNA polymerase [Clostridia bacterium]
MADADVIKIAQSLGVSVKSLYMLSNNPMRLREKRRKPRYENYRRVVIHRGRGRKNRVLSVPNEFLRRVQRGILKKYLYNLEPSEYATAYLPGFSVRANALPHTGKEFIVKTDILHFFDSIDEELVWRTVRELGFSIPATTLLTDLCVYRDRLPQGAPTSPHLANLVMRRFDEKIGAWCKERGITYTRYCDDMTFSGQKDALCGVGLIGEVRKELHRIGLQLNDEKTAFIPASQQQRVTGAVVNKKTRLSRDARRELRQAVYYCEKFGVKEHLAHRNDPSAPEEYLRSLLGKISFALQLDPTDGEMREMFRKIKKLTDGSK